MTDSFEIDVEVGGSIVISVAEERVVGSRRDSIAIEESAQEETKKRCVVEKTVAFKMFKSIVFVICIIILIIQSVDFLRIYYTYPTAIQQETTVPKNYKLPAITLCFRNTISHKKFCSYEPDWCEKPRNLEEFCRKRPFDCQGDDSNVKVPMQDEKTRRILHRYLVNDSYNDDLLFREYNYASKARTFVEEKYAHSYQHLKCYSENLHLYQSRSEVKTLKIDFREGYEHSFSSFWMYHRDIELYYPIDEPKVFLTIHSPYLPSDRSELHAIRPAKDYQIYIQLEKEEHLLPPPYQTNCRDNGPSEDAEEATNPNSFQVCLEMCLSEYTKVVRACGWGLTMVSSPSDLCDSDNKRRDLSEEKLRELEKKHFMCIQNCKEGCLKLHYKHTIQEIDTKSIFLKHTSIIGFSVKNPEVTVLRHVPVYGSGEIFSHVGGLLGCWLGISVFSFTDIMEKFFRKVVRWKRRFRKRRITLKRFRRRTEQGAPTSEIHHE